MMDTPNEIWKETPEVGDWVRAYVTKPPVRVLGVRPYTGRYPEFFTHFIRFWSPITKSEIEGCWPLGGACWVLTVDFEVV